jgi:hypothetical protein
VSETGKYISIDVDVWYDKDGTIHMVYNDGKKKGEFFHTTVNDRFDSKRGHPNLFNHLKDVLQLHGKWPVTQGNIDE